MKSYKINLSNWSETIFKETKVYEPKNINELSSLYKNNHIIPLGGNNSYGDCIFDKSRRSISTKNFNKIIKFDIKKKFIDVQSGVILRDLLNFLLQKNFIIQSLPGTYSATIGGCISCNVHGKDAFKNGTFSNNIISLKVLNLKNKIVRIKKKKDISIYTGTHGINGIILEARLKVEKILSNQLLTVTKKFDNTNTMVSHFNYFINKKFDYMGAWVDHYSDNGRGIFKASKWLKSHKLNDYFIYKKELSNLRKFIYFLFRKIFISRYFIRIFNKFLYFFSSQNEKKQNFLDFYYPQENLLPYEKKLFNGGKINIQVLVKEKNFKKFYKNLNTLCKYYYCESWWMGIKKHKFENSEHFFSDNGYDLTLQWSKDFIYKKKTFLKKLLNLLKKNKVKIYLAQDSFFARYIFDKRSLIKIKKSIKIDKKANSQLYKRLFN